MYNWIFQPETGRWYFHVSLSPRLSRGRGTNQSCSEYPETHFGFRIFETWRNFGNQKNFITTVSTFKQVKKESHRHRSEKMSGFAQAARLKKSRKGFSFLMTSVRAFSQMKRKINWKTMPDIWKKSRWQIVCMYHINFFLFNWRTFQRQWNFNGSIHLFSTSIIMQLKERSHSALTSTFASMVTQRPLTNEWAHNSFTIFREQDLTNIWHRSLHPMLFVRKFSWVTVFWFPYSFLR